MSQYKNAIDKILADNPPAPPCTPTRKAPITGANYDTSWYPRNSAEPPVILFDRNGVAYHATEPLVTDWPAGKMAVRHLVEAE